MKNSMTEWCNIMSGIEKQEFLFFFHMYNDLCQKKDYDNNGSITQEQGLNFTVSFSNGRVTQQRNCSDFSIQGGGRWFLVKEFQINDDTLPANYHPC